jgi:Holliday junction resolvase-like predicted endonuclease
MHAHDSGKAAEDQAARLFDSHGWRVLREPVAGDHRLDLLVKKGSKTYVVEIKSLKEGRPDRAIPILSQAILQAQAGAKEFPNARPLAILWVGDASRSFLQQVEAFSRRYSADMAVGVMVGTGARWFIGDGLEDLNVEADPASNSAARSSVHVANIFSDLNQWMLKVLLAPEIPEHLLNAPRGAYRNASELAKAANVSVMGAFRFAQQLQAEGFLESSWHMKLVRRSELMERWKASVLRPSPEMKCSFLLRGAGSTQLRKFVSAHDACVGYHAAAQALHLGHVQGVPPYIYVRKLPQLSLEGWKGLTLASPGEPFDLVLKQARAKESVFRAAVSVDGVSVSDVIQVWLDVSSHPSRGREQAELIWGKVLRRVIAP